MPNVRSLYCPRKFSANQACRNFENFYIFMFNITSHVLNSCANVADFASSIRFLTVSLRFIQFHILHCSELELISEFMLKISPIVGLLTCGVINWFH
jgi:hypothetical protein